MTSELLERASLTDVSKRFGFYYDEAMTHPLVVERNGTACVVMLHAAEYERLARPNYMALHPRDLY